MKSKNLHVGTEGFRPEGRRGPAGGRLGAWVPAALWGTGIFVASSFPGTAYPDAPFYAADKVVHVFFYFVLGFLCTRAWIYSAAVTPARAAVVGMIMATLFGVSDEVHQLFVAGRTGTLSDGVADAVGAIAGALAFAAWSPIRRRPWR